MTTLRELLGSAESVGVWNLVPERSSVGFMTKSMYGLVPVKGRFREFSGDGQIADDQTLFGRVDIKAASLDTKLKMRDNHLRSADFFDVEKYPDISVVVTSAESVGGDTVDLRADLTVKSTTAPISLQAQVAALDNGAVRVTTQVDINRKDFGVNGNIIGMVRDATSLTADVVFRRAGA